MELEFELELLLELELPLELELELLLELEFELWFELVLELWFELLLELELELWFELELLLWFELVLELWFELAFELCAFRRLMVRRLATARARHHSIGFPSIILSTVTTWAGVATASEPAGALAEARADFR